MRLLVVEDEASTREFLERGLREGGHTVDTANDGRDGLFLASTETYDAIILDRMLPRVDGLAVLRTLRANGTQTPVIVLSALGEIDDRVAGLRAGSDDYLTKPFAVTELLARLDALRRRAQASTAGAESNVMRCDDLELDRLARRVQRGGERVDLQPKEFQMLEYLMRHVDQVITRTMLLEAVWDYHFDPGTNVIDAHISNLRGKLNRGSRRPLIHTVRGAGYRFGSAHE